MCAFQLLTQGIFSLFHLSHPTMYVVSPCGFSCILAFFCFAPFPRHPYPLMSRADFPQIPVRLLLSYLATQTQKQALYKKCNTRFSLNVPRMACKEAAPSFVSLEERLSAQAAGTCENGWRPSHAALSFSLNNILT